MQILPDPFLGWTTIEDRHFVVRKLAEQKASIEAEDLNGPGLAQYATTCGGALAKAQVRT